MKKLLRALVQSILLGSLISWSTGVLGAPAVLESQASRSGQGIGSQSGAGAGNNDALLLLLEQNRNLQAEVQALRALVEEQGYEVRKLQRESLERYTNTDTRLSSLEQSYSSGTTASSDAGNTASQSPAPVNRGLTSRAIDNSPSSVPTSPLPSTTPPSRTFPGAEPDSRAGLATGVGSASVATSPRTSRSTPSRPTLEPAVLSEQQLYQMAYDSAINSQFERAIAEFDQYLSIYPSGRFTTNAHYWKGQAYLYLSRYTEAVAAYDIILQQHADSAKVPDALYGLGVAYEGMGNTQRARQIMQEIISKYPNTGVANLADTRLLSLD